VPHRRPATRIEIDEDSFARLPDVVALVRCPHCGSEHEWTKEMAWVIGDDELPP
jgi:hypothetical protein